MICMRDALESKGEHRTGGLVVGVGNARGVSVWCSLCNSLDKANFPGFHQACGTLSTISSPHRPSAYGNSGLNRTLDVHFEIDESPKTVLPMYSTMATKSNIALPTLSDNNPRKPAAAICFASDPLECA